MLESTFHYLAPMAEKPYFHAHRPPEGAPPGNARGDHRTVPVADARTLQPPPSLDVEGFAMETHRTRVSDFYDAVAIKSDYYPEIEALVAGVTGATWVVAFDHNVRQAGSARAQDPVRFVHNDYTLSSGPQRLRDLLAGEDVDSLLRRRFAVVNVWKPIRGPVRDTPLAVLDARSIEPADFVTTDLRYEDRTGEIYSLTWRDSHRWFHYPEQCADEALLLKCYDSDPTYAQLTAHSAFDIPDAPHHGPRRESVEVRTLVSFG